MEIMLTKDLINAKLFVVPLQCFCVLLVGIVGKINFNCVLKDSLVSFSNKD